MLFGVRMISERKRVFVNYRKTAISFNNFGLLRVSLRMIPCLLLNPHYTFRHFCTTRYLNTVSSIHCIVFPPNRFHFIAFSCDDVYISPVILLRKL